MVRYYSWYSNRTRGIRKRRGIQKPGADIEESNHDKVLDVTDYRPPRVPSRTWRQLIQKVWEIGPLLCPGAACGNDSV
jgi:hypothetical protein